MLFRSREVPSARFTFTVAEDDGDVVCRAQVAYGERVYDLFAEGDAGPVDAAPAWAAPVRPAPPSAFSAGRAPAPRSVLAPERQERDDVAECRAAQVVEEFFPDGYPQPKFSWDDDERLYRLLTEGLRELRSLGEVLLSERLRGAVARPAPKLSVRATVRSGLLDVELGASGMKPAELVAYLASYRRRQRFVRLTDGEIVRIDDSAREAEALGEELGVRAADLVEGVHGLPLSRAVLVDALLDRMEMASDRRDGGFRDLVASFDALSEADFSVPASLRADLRSYQLDGFRWLGALERMGCGGILADDMGLGKTLQMIAHILARREAGEEGPTLVVCPASLVYNWMAELERFAPSLRAVALTGAAPARAAAIARSAESDVLVTSYDLMKRDIEELCRQDLRRVVLDEAQYIKNPGTQAARAAKLLPAQMCIRDRECAVRYESSAAAYAGRTFTVGGMCKGSGMIMPNMATMIAVVTTDAPVAPAALHAALSDAVAHTFNKVTVDSDTSTNDTCVDVYKRQYHIRGAPASTFRSPPEVKRPQGSCD